MPTGEPVGSRKSRACRGAAVARLGADVMADLEQLGLIYAPHTSAGRLPNELGLRCSSTP